MIIFFSAALGMSASGPAADTAAGRNVAVPTMVDRAFTVESAYGDPARSEILPPEIRVRDPGALGARRGACRAARAASKKTPPERGQVWEECPCHRASGCYIISGLMDRPAPYWSLTVRFNSFPHLAQLNVRISKSGSAGSIREDRASSAVSQRPRRDWLGQAPSSAWRLAPCLCHMEDAACHLVSQNVLTVQLFDFLYRIVERVTQDRHCCLVYHCLFLCFGFIL